MGWPIKILPTRKSEYKRFVKNAVAILREEVDRIIPSYRSKNFIVGTMGLSLGAALAQYAAYISNGFIQRHLSINPYYALDVPGSFGLQKEWLHCKNETMPEECLRDWFHDFFHKAKRHAPVPQRLEDLFVEAQRVPRNRTESKTRNPFMKIKQWFGEKRDTKLGNYFSTHTYDFLNTVRKFLVRVHNNAANRV